ncbi:MAG TPA: cytochrome c oxidase accessory protein CcoG, partial [Polyangiaceae bacterium]|nr:cytochrome c oxidase accessory protein CcoG [Polyangiaceae bacterium]
MTVAPAAPRRVLPTLNQDGSRRWIRPRPFDGRFVRARRKVGWGLIALFVTLPFVRVAGNPALLFDIPARQFHFFGATLRATDGVLLMLLLLAIFVAIFAITAWLGRAWCGWGCPQTVYLEFVFRPLERWIEGGRNAQLHLDREGPNARRFVRYAVFALLSVLLGNLFLSYFVGVERLKHWMTESPFTHPTGSLVVLVTSLLVYADFGYFREQMCTVACPYARLQSVLLDPKSIVVGYDAGRGEPRGRGTSNGDCVDCGACVATCPTGIDIRDGLQLECIACAQCVDACDSVMTKFNRPRGLVRYDASHALHGVKGSLRPHRSRLFVYSAVLVALVGGLVFFARGASRPEVTLLRGLGAPFELVGGSVRNQVRLKIQNRSSAGAAYHIDVLGVPG